MVTSGPRDLVDDDSGVRESAFDGIVTPDAVVLELETAGMASRVCAGLIDLGVQLALLLVVATALAGAGLYSDGGGSTDGVDDSTQQTVLIVLTTLVLFGYPVVLETVWRGRTVGKRAIGLRAVTIEGGPVRLRHATLRMMGGIVDRFMPPGGVTGVVFVLTTRRCQRVGDLIAGTIVVRDPDRTPLPRALWFPVPVGYEVYAATIDPTAVTAEQYTLVRAFLVRVKELTPDARLDVASRLAAELVDVLRHSRPVQVHPETFLLCVISRYQRRLLPARQLSSPPSSGAR